MEYTNIYNQEYVDLLKHRMYVVKLKFEILDWSEKVVEEISYDIASDNLGKISVNYNQGVRRTISFSLYDYNGKYKPSEDSPFQTYKKFKVYLGIKNNDNIYWWSQGVFIAKNVSYSNRVLEVEGVDKFGVFTDALDFCVLQETYIIPAGTRVKNIVSDILLLESKKMSVYDSKDAIIGMKYVNATLPYEIKKEIGSYLGDILIEIAKSLNADIYYDADGHLRLEENKDGQYVTLQPMYHYEKDDLIDFKTNIDLSNAKNIYTVYGYDEFEGLHQYTAINDNPLSPIRTSLLGNKPEEPEENDMCTNDDTCVDYANYLLKHNSMYVLANSLQSHIIPHLEVDNTVAITDSYYGLDYIPFVIKSLSIPLGVGLTNIELTNIQYLPNYFTDITFTNILYEPTIIRMKVATPTDNYEITIPKMNSLSDSLAMDMKFNFGDGTAIQTYKNNVDVLHTYAIADDYVITMNSTKEIKESMWFKDNEIITELNFINVGVSVDSVLQLESFTFYNCINLTKITVADNIEVYISAYCFANCTSLTEVTLGDSVAYIGEFAFANCGELTNVTIGKDIEYIGFKAFANCSSLTTIKYHGTEEEWENIRKEDNYIDEGVTIEFI